MRILNLLRKEIGIIRRKLCTEGKGNHLDVNNVNGIKIQGFLKKFSTLCNDMRLA